MRLCSKPRGARGVEPETECFSHADLTSHHLWLLRPQQHLALLISQAFVTRVLKVRRRIPSTELSLCRGFSENAAGEPVPGDLIIAVGGERVQSSEDIAAIVEQFSVGDQVPVTLLRGRQEVIMNVPLIEMPDAVG